MTNLETLLNDIKSRYNKATGGQGAIMSREARALLASYSRQDIHRLVAALEYCIDNYLDDNFPEEYKKLETILKGASSDG